MTNNTPDQKPRPSDAAMTTIAVHDAIRDLLNDLAILAGDVIGPSGVSWQDVAGTASVNAYRVARILEASRQMAGVVFPSPNELLESLS